MGQSHCDYNKNIKLIKRVIINLGASTKLISKINYEYKIKIPCVMSMNIFDPNECVNKEKCSVCMHWTKKIYVNMCTMYMYKNKL